MAQRSVNIIGLQELERALNALPARIEKRVVENALTSGARLIVREAKARVPVDTGQLRNSIRVARLARQQRRQAGRVFIGFRPPASRRAHLTEFGTSKQAAQPFMRPALDTKAGEFFAQFRKMLSAGLEREAKKLR